MYKIHQYSEQKFSSSQVESIVPLDEVCGVWGNNFGAPRITIYRSVKLYRMIYDYGNGIKFLCSIVRNTQQNLTYFDLYGKILMAYDRENDLLLTAEGPYTREDYQGVVSNRKRVKNNKLKITHMKKSIVIMVVALIGFTYQAKAQWAVIDPSNLVQNILTVGKTATTATNVINSFKEMKKIYDQGKEYYDKLQTVNGIIKDYRKVKETIEMVSEISDIYVVNFNKMLSDPNFSVDELSAISDGYAKLMRQGGSLLGDVRTIITSSNGLSMSDSERMLLVDKIHSEMSEYCNLTRYYTNKNISVSYLRAKKKNDTDRIVALYGHPTERYW